MPCRHLTGGARAVGALADAQDGWTLHGLLWYMGHVMRQRKLLWNTDADWGRLRTGYVLLTRRC
jgi:hypothetical protein